MARKTAVDKLSQSINSILSDYESSVKEDIDAITRKMGSAGKIRVEDNFLNKHFSTKVSLLIERLLNDNYQNGTTLKF